jgi:Uncharacterised nucleotidyltransferase
MSSDLSASRLAAEEVDRWAAAWHRWLTADKQPDASSEPREAPRLRLLAKSVLGISLDGEEQQVLDHWRHAAAEYRRYLDIFATSAPECVVLKGLTLAALYPDGWIRASGDLDLYAATRQSFWAVGRRLLDDGWRLHRSFAWHAEDGPALGFVLMQVCSECGGKLEIGLFEVRSVTDGQRLAPRRDLPMPASAPLAAQVVPVLAEGFERQLTLRDVFDVRLVCDTLGDRPTPAWDVIDAAGLWPEYQQLVAVGQRWDVPVPAAPEDLARCVVADRRGRSTRRRALLRSRAGLAAAAGHLSLRVRPEGVRQVVSRLIGRLASPADVFAAGLLVCGARLDPTPGADRFTTTGGRCRAETPLGQFEFTHLPDLFV